MAEGEFALVEQHLRQAIREHGQPTRWGTIAHELDIYILLTDAAAQRRDQEALRYYVTLAEEFALREEHTLYQAISHRAWGVAHRLAGEYGEAESRFHRALDLFQTLETRWQMGRTLYEMAELEDTRGNKSMARDCFERALNEFEAMRAVPDAANVRARLQN